LLEPNKVAALAERDLAPVALVGLEIADLLDKRGQRVFRIFLVICLVTFLVGLEGPDGFNDKNALAVPIFATHLILVLKSPLSAAKR
jgi:hypothetical protein